MKKLICVVLGLMTIFLITTPLLTPSIYNQQVLSSIIINYSYEINVNDPSTFHYVLIPTNKFGVEESSNVTIFMKSYGNKHLTWQKARNNQVFSNYSYLEEIYDETDTTWLNITFPELDPDENHRIIIYVDYQRYSSKAIYFSNRTINKTLWLKPTKYIDSDHPSIIEKAEELTQYKHTRKEKVTEIIKFIKTLEFNESYKHSEMWNSSSGVEEEGNASDTLRIRKGVCLNFARLCVALCRASGIPARVIIGYYVTKSKDIWGNYPVGGHVWVEFLETDDSWNIIDPRDTIFRNLPLYYFQQIKAPYQEESFFIEREDAYTFNLSAERDNYVHENYYIHNATLLMKNIPNYDLIRIYFGIGAVLSIVDIFYFIKSRKNRKTNHN